MVVLSDLVEVISSGEKMGLQLNPQTCKLMVLWWGNSQAPFVEAISELLPGIKVIRLCQCELLGAPLTSEALPRALTHKIETIGLLVERLPSLQSHTALFLLKNCLATPKLVYLLRCSPTFQEPGLLIELDSIIRIGLETLLNVSIDEQKLGFRLPYRCPEVFKVSPFQSFWFRRRTLPTLSSGFR
jgi:hypothetical protein